MIFCYKCGNQINDDAVFCNKCGTPQQQPVVPQAQQQQNPQVQQPTAHQVQQPATPQTNNEPKKIGDNAGIRMLIPVGRSGFAIAAGYLGILSFIPAFGFLALIFGIIAIIDIQKHPHRHGMGRAIFAIVAGVLSIVIYSIVFFI